MYPVVSVRIHFGPNEKNLQQTKSSKCENTGGHRYSRGLWHENILSIRIPKQRITRKHFFTLIHMSLFIIPVRTAGKSCKLLLMDKGYEAWCVCSFKVSIFSLTNCFHKFKGWQVLPIKTEWKPGLPGDNFFNMFMRSFNLHRSQKQK